MIKVDLILFLIMSQLFNESDLLSASLLDVVKLRLEQVHLFSDPGLLSINDGLHLSLVELYFPEQLRRLISHTNNLLLADGQMFGFLIESRLELVGFSSAQLSDLFEFGRLLLNFSKLKLIVMYFRLELLYLLLLVLDFELHLLPCSSQVILHFPNLLGSLNPQLVHLSVLQQ